MSIEKIKLSPDLYLPAREAVTQKIAFLARSGAGKTYAAGKLVEELIGAGGQVVVVDPVGVWWGLRLAANGKAPGIPDFYVFGGQRGDVPLEATAGNLIADVIVDHGLSMVIDVSDFTGGEQRRFVADFATHLLQRKKQARSPLMVVWEECQDFVPQRVMHDSARMVGAMERLIKQGRNFGVGTTLISQRPQAVNKDVLNQTECLIVLQTTGPQERKTIQGWVAENAADVAAAVDELPSLERGEAFVWSPQWLRTFKRVKIGKKWTFDASSTPTEQQSKVRELAPVDLNAVRSAMAETVERAKLEDPKLLRVELARLKAELSKKPAAPASREKRVEVPVFSDAQMYRLEHLLDKLDKTRDGMARAVGDISRRLIDALIDVRGEIVKATRTPATIRPIDPQPPQVQAPRRVTASRPTTDGVSGSQQRVLDALAWFAAFGIAQPTREALAPVAKTRPTSGGFKNNLGALRSTGLIDYPTDGRVVLTEAGRAAASAPAIAPSVESMHQAALDVVTTAQAAILRACIISYPAASTREQLAETVGVSPTSGGFKNNLGALRTLGFVDYPETGTVAATEILFPAGLS